MDEHDARDIEHFCRANNVRVYHTGFSSSFLHKSEHTHQVSPEAELRGLSMFLHRKLFYSSEWLRLSGCHSTPLAA